MNSKTNTHMCSDTDGITTAPLGDNSTAITNRRCEVHLMQQLYGMVPREDSNLTELYARGLLNNEWTAITVAQELVIVNHLHQHSPYGSDLEALMRRVASVIKKTYTLSWTRVWKIVRFYVPSMYKLYCFENLTVELPKF